MKALEREMQQKGMTQVELARVSGVSRVKVNRIINGREKAWPKYRAAIARALGWQGDPAELFEEVEV